MKYQVGDQYFCNGIVCMISYVNQDYAWLAPIDEKFPGLRGICMYRLGSDGRTDEGYKVYPIQPEGRSMAV